jgi:hypothetical protein
VRHESDMRVHTVFAAHQLAQVLGPVKSRRIDHALDAARAGSRDIHLNAPEVAMLVGFYGREKRIGAIHG